MSSYLATANGALLLTLCIEVLLLYSINLLQTRNKNSVSKIRSNGTEVIYIAITTTLLRWNLFSIRIS